MRQGIRVVREVAGCHATELGIFLGGGSNARFGEESHKQYIQKKTAQHRTGLKKQELRRTENVKSE